MPIGYRGEIFFTVMTIISMVSAVVSEGTGRLLTSLRGSVTELRTIGEKGQTGMVIACHDLLQGG
jgi:hypothetical protein